MIFKPELVELIINRRKTQTRRKAKPDTPCAYKPGKHYAVQPGRGQKAVERIWITDVRQDTVGEIGHQDSLREGFENIGAFIEYWEALYRRDMDYDQPVWVISFELYRGQDKTPKGPRQLRDVTRSLHVPMDPGQPAQDGFAERRRAPEPARISEVDEETFTKENWMRWKAANGDLHARRELNRLGRSVREEGIRAMRRGVDVSAELTNIQRELDAIRQRAA